MINQQQIITRSGYRYELYEAIADDGYVTQTTRLINPLADKRYLRQPPVLMEHGGTINPSAYIVASSIQHHPERWPRTARDGPITSWNRSLAFVLANNGFDVFLAETRGSSDVNRKYIHSRAVKSVIEGRYKLKNLTAGEISQSLEKHTNWDYWDFSQDDIVAHEIKSHIDLVLEKTGSEKILMFTFSLSTPTSFGFFSLRPDYAEKVQGLVSMAPIVSGEHINRGAKLVLDIICPLTPEFLGTFFLEDILFTQTSRDLMLFAAKSKWIRYSFIKAVLNYGMGASAKYQTVIDLNFLGHLLRSLSFKEAQQLCQQMRSNKLSKYDYGKVKNLHIYGTETPPEYKLSEFHVKDWIIVLAENDGLSTQDVYKHLMREVFPKPKSTIFAPGFNHADLFAGFENDRYINLPVLSYYQSRSIVPGLENIFRAESSARQLDLTSVIPGMKNLQIPNLSDLGIPFEMPKESGSDIVSSTLKTLQRELSKNLNLTDSSESVFDQVQINMRKMLGGVENFSLNNILNSESQAKEKQSSYSLLS